MAKSVPWPQAHYDEVDAMEKARSVGVVVPTVRRIIFCYRHATYTRPDSRATLVAPGAVGHPPGCLAAQSLYILSAYRYFTNNWRFKFRKGPLGMDSRMRLPPQFPNLDWWLTKARPSNCEALPRLRLSPLLNHVLVHQDLAPRNMILDANRQL